MPDDVSSMQALRKARERIPFVWEFYRQALIDSGLVEERRKMREEDAQ
ncbi:MAG: hypothetical protein ACYDCJ_12400 [Gammaproteobacteria bacterium]